jgi:hypothetical protein
MAKSLTDYARWLYRHRLYVLGIIGWGLIMTQPVPDWQFPQYGRY